MNDPQMQFTDNQLLLAFRYVAGELTVDESEFFEQQLLTDQSLCEAVVEAVFLGSLVASSSAPIAATRLKLNSSCVVRPSLEPVRRSYSYLVTGVTACLCLFMLMAIYSRSTVQPIGVSQMVQQDDAELLVSVWATEPEEAGDLALDESDLIVEELDVPDWLLAAVTIAGLEEFPAADDDMEL